MPTATRPSGPSGTGTSGWRDDFTPPRLERFEREANDVEQAHRFAFIPRFQAGPEHPKLDRQRGDEQQVVAWHAKDTRLSWLLAAMLAQKR